MAAPAGGHGPAAGAAVRGLGRGRPSSPLFAAAGGTRSLALARLCLGRSALGTHAGLCPPSAGKAARVKIGGVLRGVLPRSSALRASGGGARVF